MKQEKLFSTADRLRQIMTERGLKQADILRLCDPICKQLNIKIGRNDLSQYVTGKVEPGQYKLIVLGRALNVSETWLMGFDVPKERPQSTPSPRSSSAPSFPITPHEQAVIEAYRAHPSLCSAVDRMLEVPPADDAEEINARTVAAAVEAVRDAKKEDVPAR